MWKTLFGYMKNMLYITHVCMCKKSCGHGGVYLPTLSACRNDSAKIGLYFNPPNLFFVNQKSRLSAAYGFS